MVFTVVAAKALIVVVIFVAAVVVVSGSLAVIVAFAVADVDVAVVTFVHSESMNLHRENYLLDLPGYKPKPLAK